MKEIRKTKQNKTKAQSHVSQCGPCTSRVSNRMQTIRPHRRPPAGKLRVGNSNLYFNKPSGFGRVCLSLRTSLQTTVLAVGVPLKSPIQPRHPDPQALSMLASKSLQLPHLLRAALREGNQHAYKCLEEVLSIWNSRTAGSQ